MVVMGPGDELTVEFSVPKDAPPEGWTRDFVLYNVGWDKDADLNTVYGQSSEPYPFKAMTRYPIARKNRNRHRRSTSSIFASIKRASTRDSASATQSAMRFKTDPGGPEAGCIGRYLVRRIVKTGDRSAGRPALERIRDNFPASASILATGFAPR